ncbi:MAG: acetoacetate--CoA ligase [Acidimicrobiia bacterium]
MDTALWEPDPERIASSAMDRFRQAVAGSTHLDLPDTEALHRWSVEDPDGFWRAAWGELDLLGDPGAVTIEPGTTMPETRFFPQGRLSFTENMLRGYGGDDRAAIIWEREDGARRACSWHELRSEVGAAAAALQAAGVGTGDRVAAWMPNVPETVVVMLATLSLGAVFTSSSADFGTAGVVDRFGQVGPKVVVAADGYLYGGKRLDCLVRLAEIVARLPTVSTVVVVGHLEQDPEITGVTGAVAYPAWLEPHRGAAVPSTAFEFDQPGFVLYSSGTTGTPKCIVHRTGGILLKHRVEQVLHCDIRPGDTVFYFTTCGWMMWNWLTSALAAGATIVLYEGNPFHPGPEVLLDLADRYGVTLFGVSAKYIDSLRKAGLRPRESHDLGTMRTICSTGSPLSPEGFTYVYGDVKADVHLASISGGTDLCGCFVAGDPTRPVWAGEIQGPVLGMAVDVFDEAGRPLATGRGELVCTAPFPSMPLGFWGDADGSRYRAAYFERFPGVWAHGDFASWTPHGGMVIHGRSDATLNSAGVRIGTAEIYRAVENLPEIVEAIAVGQEHDGDTRIVLFVRMAEGHELTDEVQALVRRTLRTQCSPRHVPAVIAAVTDLPRTRSGKITELAVGDVVNGRVVRNTEAMANPEALEQFRERPELAT